MSISRRRKHHRVIQVGHLRQIIVNQWFLLFCAAYSTYLKYGFLQLRKVKRYESLYRFLPFYVSYLYHPYHHIHLLPVTTDQLSVVPLSTTSYPLTYSGAYHFSSSFSSSVYFLWWIALITQKCPQITFKSPSLSSTFLPLSISSFPFAAKLPETILYTHYL